MGLQPCIDRIRRKQKYEKGSVKEKRELCLSSRQDSPDACLIYSDWYYHQKTDSTLVYQDMPGATRKCPRRPDRTINAAALSSFVPEHLKNSPPEHLGFKVNAEAVASPVHHYCRVTYNRQATYSLAVTLQPYLKKQQTRKRTIRAPGHELFSGGNDPRLRGDPIERYLGFLFLCGGQTV